MKHLLHSFMTLAIVFLFASCTTEPIEVIETSEEIAQTVASTPCVGENPKARLTNNSNLVANLEIFDENGVLVNHEYDLQPGETSDWKDFNAGEVSFKISTTASEKAITIDMVNCSAYDVTIDENNHLNTDTANGVD